MPLWALVLTLCFGAVSAIATIFGMFWHRTQSAKDSGALRQEVATASAEIGRLRDALPECQTVATCSANMQSLNSRIDNAHKRMDRLEGRIDRIEQ